MKKTSHAVVSFDYGRGACSEKPIDESARPLYDPLPFADGDADPKGAQVIFASCAANLAPNPPRSATEISPKSPSTNPSCRKRSERQLRRWPHHAAGPEAVVGGGAGAA